MSLAEDDGSLTESEIHLQPNEFDPKDRKDEDVKSKELLPVNQRPRRTVSPLTLFREDLNYFKEELLNVFKDKDAKTTHEENKPAVSTLDLLKEDLSQFKEDVTSVFNKDKDTKSADPKTSQLINPLSLLKEDFNHFRDDISSAFRVGLSKERDNKGVPARDVDKIKESESGERSHKPFNNLFRAENIHEDKKIVSEKINKQMDGSFRGNLSELNAETVEGKKMSKKKLEKCELDVNVFEEKSISETQQSEEISTGETGGFILKRNYIKNFFYKLRNPILYSLLEYIYIS